MHRTPTSYRASSLTPALVLLALLAGCVEPPDEQSMHDGELSGIEAELSADQRLARYAQIRDAAAGRGIDHTGYLLAGIAYAETGLAHCWSEATWACQGPGSADCGGGPVIAGAGDGPCADLQGGLGMFQFDAGTHSQTLATYGEHILTVAGNTSQALDFVINMVRRSTYTTGASTNELALQWIIRFNVNDATLRDQWVKTVTRYYNGCQPTSSCWNQRYNHYNNSLQTVLDETGLEFWAVPTDQPPTGWIDGATCDAITGWAQDPDAPDTALDVHVYYGGTAGSGAPGKAVHADVHRDDLCSAIGSCRHGYVAPAPLSLADGQAHPIHAYGIGAAGGANAQLSGSPQDLVCAGVPLDGVRRHVVNPTSYDAWALDAFYDRPPLPESTVLALEQGPDVPATPRLVRADDGDPAVWVVDGALRRHVTSPAVMAAWRFDWDDIETRPAAELDALTEGAPWRPRPVQLLAGGAVYLLDDAPPPDDQPGDDTGVPDPPDAGSDAGHTSPDTGSPGDDTGDDTGSASPDTIGGESQAPPPPVYVKDACATGTGRSASGALGALAGLVALMGWVMRRR